MRLAILQAALPSGLATHRRCPIMAQQVQSQKGARTKKPKASKKQQTVASASVEELSTEEAKRKSDEERMAITASVGAARALARRLANEQQTAIAAARSAASRSLDEEEVEAIKRSVEASSSAAARELAQKRARERQTRKGRIVSSDQLAELARLKEENEALQRLVLEMAANKKDARQRVAGLRQKFNDLVSEIANGAALELGALEAAQQEAQAAAEAVAAAPEKEEEIMRVVNSLAVAREASGRKAQPEDSIRLRAEQAAAEGQPLFFTPEEGIPVGSTGTLFYNAAHTQLPWNGRLQLKAGVNKWQDILVLDMQQVPELEGLEGSNWWSVDLSFDEDVFQVDFVVMDEGGGAVDNNRGQDFRLPLVGALTEEGILQRQAAAMAQLEERRLQILDVEEERLWQQQREAAYREADVARERFKEHFEDELWAAAAEAAAERRGRSAGVSAQEQWEGVLTWEHPPVAGATATVIYNKDSGSLRHAGGVTMHYGFDAWHEGSISLVELSAVPSEQRQQLGLPEYGDWWRGSIEVPKAAEILDFVLSNPERTSWENNSNRDFHVPVQQALSREELIRMLFEEAWHERQSELLEGQDSSAKRTIRKMEEKAKAMRRRRDLQRHIFYTEPATPAAGQAVSLFYNPDLTSLRGRPEVWLRGSHNRWAHPQRFGPVQMHSVVKGGVGFHKAQIEVPQDAWIIDFVLADSPDGGAFFDNNNGMDYHIAVSGSSIPPPPLNVVHVAVEMAPIAKVGGMADVVTALSRAVQEAGHNVKVILPKYDVINYAEVKGITQTGDFWWSSTQVKVWEGVVEGLETVFLEPCNGSVWAGCIYGRNDDAARFGFFCGAVLDYLKHHYTGPTPDILHAHDWQSAPVVYGDVHPSRSVFTIHNMEFGVDQIGRAVAAADVSTTVSPTYAMEVSGHPAIAPHLEKFYGIRNGIDQEIWDPLFDRFLPRMFSADNVAEGKAAAKAELRARMDLSSADVPLVSVVTRLTHQKGIHLIKHAAWRTLERGGQFVLLGSAPDPRIQGEFNALAGDMAKQYPDCARLWFAYDEPLSHLIYAGSDIFLVPSMFEPCGLTQMIAMRYGTIPVVRKTGGLNDTVFDVDDDVERAQAAGMEPNGFSFVGADAAGLDYALNRALEVWYTDKGLWDTLTQRVMQQDWSWAEPALDYIEMYYKALKGI